MIKSINELKNQIKGIEELKHFVGTRRDIYNLISNANPLAIIDYRNANVKINNVDYLIILKKINKDFKTKIFWDITNKIQYIFD